MSEEDFDSIDSRSHRAPARKRPIKRAVSVRERAVSHARTHHEEDDAGEYPFSSARPRISIDAATSGHHRKVNVYKRLATLFIGATVCVVAVIGFFTFQRATVTITQTPAPITASFSVEVAELGNGATIFAGTVVTVTTSTEQIFKPSATVDKPGKARGTVTVYNKGSAAQSLVATTRFLSESGVLFRAAKAVTVPAQGSATAEIVADAAGPSGDVPAGRFTIPGLSAAQQKIVYGESTTAMTGGSSKMGVVSQSDIDKAQEESRKAFLEIAQGQIMTNTVQQGFEPLYVPVSIKAESSAKPGDEVSEFRIMSSGTLALIAYPKAAVFAAADREVQAKAPTAYHKIIFANDAPVISLQSIDVEKKTALLQVYREGTAVLDGRSAAFQPSMFMGQSREQIENQIKSISGVNTVSLSFFPPWIDHAPKVPSRIKVIIE